MKLQPLGARMPTLSSRPSLTPTLRTVERLRGRALQAVRYRLWLANPTCAGCGRVVGYPNGFELDHKQPLDQGGTNDDGNLQLLCIERGQTMTGCHGMKSRSER